MFPLIPAFWEKPMTEILMVAVLAFTTESSVAVLLDEDGNVHYALGR